MIGKLFFILSFFSFFDGECQNQSDSNSVGDTSIASQLYTKCFENLNQGNELLDKYPAFKDHKVCSLMICSVLLAYKEADIQAIGEQRLIGIATQLFKEGNPVYLISGFESYLYAKEKNLNLEDDNHIVYISYGECTNPEYLHRAAKIINDHTSLLIKQSVAKPWFK